MPLTPGSRLGPYEITAAIGAGGMGEVYRARDARLGRDVALKVLPEAFARDAERMARFQREAKVLASLNHTNIASIHGLEDSGSTHALVMELVEGPQLADRIKQGPIPVDEALRIAKQICEALEYAHERGIVHRDLKPANIKVSADDIVKILDFGLAKAVEGDAVAVDIATSPTITRMATMQGVLLGTAAYMSPEQAKAKPVDRRADIWAFGCVLYEMLTGKMAFRGESVTDTLAAVIHTEPDVSKLPTVTPTRIRVLLQRCLQKDPKQRLRDIGDARIALEEVLSGAPDPVGVGTSQAITSKYGRVLPWGVAALLFVALASVALVRFRQKSAPAPPVRFEIASPDPSADVVRISPDGMRLVFVGAGVLWLRRMDSIEGHPIEGTEGAGGIPFWSPDSRFVVFNADNKLKKVDPEGGPPQVLCEMGRELVGGFWTRDDRIVFGDQDRRPGLWEVSATGGLPSPLPGVEHAGEPYTFGPFPLPDGRHFLYSGGSAEGANIYLGSLDSNQPRSQKLLTEVFDNAIYAPSLNNPELGYLLFVRDAVTRTLVAQPFDLRKLDVAGDPVPIADRVSLWSLSASLTGTLVYSSGEGGSDIWQPTIFDRQGKVLGTAGEPGNYRFVAFSPDSKRVVMTRYDSQSGSTNIWMTDLARGSSTRFTFDAGSDYLPTWSPDGSRIAFSSVRDGKYDLYQKRSDGGTDEEMVFKSDTGLVFPLSWSGDGRFLLIAMSVPSTDPIVSVLPVDGAGHVAGKPFSFVQKGVGIEERFSPGPNGRALWVAYSSMESGAYEVYVRPFDPGSPTGTPPEGGKWQVSTQGGFSPRWNGNGKELFYVRSDGTVMSVEVSGNDGVFQAGVPKPLFKPKGLAPQNPDYFYWDASSDGKQFIFVVSPSASATVTPPRFTVVLNWPSLLNK